MACSGALVGRSFTVFDVRALDGQVVPVMCSAAEDGGTQIECGVLRYVAYLRNRGDSLRQTRAKCFALGLLRDFYLYVWLGDITRPLGLSDLCVRFLRARRNGLHLDPSVEHSGLRWPPVRSETASRDRRTLDEYAEFCLTHSESFSVLPLNEAQAYACLDDLKRLMIFKSAQPHLSSLLAHIGGFRRPRLRLNVNPSEITRYPRRKTSRSKAFIPADQAKFIIDRTKSTMQKMLLIEAFFGGPRLSEMLHQWRCDVMPGSYRKKLFPDDSASAMPLVVLAHPCDSTYTGSLFHDKLDRYQHLIRFYGLRPRNMLAGNPSAAGWKGIAFDEPYSQLSQVFWVSQEYAHLYFELYMDFQVRICGSVPPEILQSHPYLYINDDPKQSQFGLPLKISNARKIFRRAIERVETIGPEYKVGPHSARHTYTSLLKRLLMNKDDIAKCLHHKSPLSQEEYAKGSSETRARLAAALDQRLSI